MQLVDPMLNFLFITELLMHSILILFFSCRVEHPSVFTTTLCTCRRLQLKKMPVHNFFVLRLRGTGGKS